jgi:hypothetical protein
MNVTRRISAAAWAVFFVIGAGASAQVPAVCRLSGAPALPGVGAERADFARAAGLLGGSVLEVMIRRPSAEWAVEAPCSGVWGEADSLATASLQPAAWVDMVFNSGYPHGNQTGALWPGRGIQTLWTAGISLRAGPLRVGLHPQVAWHQNSSFPIVPYPDSTASEYAYPWWRGRDRPRIDWPQRFGAESFWTVAPGQSYVSLEGYGVRGGLSTENIWWGPAQRQSIMAGNEAEGFPHVFLGTRDGWSGRAGRLDVQSIWGLLTESDYYEDDPANDHRLLTSVAFAWQPPGPRGLSIGLARIFYQTWNADSIGVGDLIPFLESPLKDDQVTEENPGGDDVMDQIVALYARYAIPGTGFEVYGELARNDHAQNLKDLLGEPDHTRAYTLGFQKVGKLGADIGYRARGEMTALGVTRTFLHRSAGPYYAHGVVPAGYTHRGQLLGAGIGPGSDAQYLGFDIYTPRGRHGVHVQRVRYDDDAFYRFAQRNFYGHDIELTAGTSHYVRVGAFDVRVGVEFSSRRNRNFRYCSPLGPNPGDLCQEPRFRDQNWHIPLGVVWRLPAR